MGWCGAISIIELPGQPLVTPGALLLLENCSTLPALPSGPFTLRAQSEALRGGVMFHLKIPSFARARLDQSLLSGPTLVGVETSNILNVN